MKDPTEKLNSPLFQGIAPEDRKSILHCMGYYVKSFPKGSMIGFENESVKYIGIVLSGVVDMVKEDFWGNRTMLVRIQRDQVFGETFACGDESACLVIFQVTEAAEILFMPFNRIMRTCTMSCEFHHRLTENMVTIMANKNRELMRKVEVVTKRTIREKLLAYLSIQGQLCKSVYFEIPLSRTELAEYLCVDRSAMTRELAKMKDEGLIDYDKNSFRMLMVQ